MHKNTINDSIIIMESTTVYTSHAEKPTNASNCHWRRINVEVKNPTIAAMDCIESNIKHYTAIINTKEYISCKYNLNCDQTFYSK